jgi:hypothetical protein
MAEWYYSTNKKQLGPVSLEELRHLAREGLLKPTDLVWTDGMSDWARAGSQGFFPQDKNAAMHGAWSPRSSRVVEAGDKDRPSRSRDVEHEEDADRPRRRQQRRAEGGMPVGVKVGLIVGGVVLVLIVLGVGLYILMRPSGFQEIAAGMGNFQGFLGPNDPLDPNTGGPSRVHDVRMVRGRTYIIDLRSTQFDAFLRLEDSALTQLAQDDDSGGNLDARIIFRCPRSGNFRVIASGLPNSRGNGRGAYNLTIRESH